MQVADLIRDRPSLRVGEKCNSTAWGGFLIREAADCDDVQINFGVILNESMQDAVKITVIATGFTPEAAPQPERRTAPDVRKPVRPEPVSERIAEREPAPLKVEPEPKPVAQPEPEPPALDLDDLDTPAYLRQGRLLN